VIEMKQKIALQPEFQQDELITWHEYQGSKCIPVPGVVVRQEAESVLIKTCVAGRVKQVTVPPEQLAHR
jgi:hypothetical protein